MKVVSMKDSEKVIGKYAVIFKTLMDGRSESAIVKMVGVTGCVPYSRIRYRYMSGPNKGKVMSSATDPNAPIKVWSKICPELERHVLESRNVSRKVKAALKK